MSSSTLSVVARIDDAVRHLREAGHEPTDVVMNDTVYAAFMVQGEADTFAAQPTTIRGLPIIRSRDGTPSAVRAAIESQPGRASVIIG